MIKRFWNWIRHWKLRGTLTGVSGEVLSGAAPKEEKFNPIKWQGTKWVTLRETSTGLHAQIWYEVDRNSIGRVTVVPAYGWKTNDPCTGLDKQLSELLTEEQADEKLTASKHWHPATMLMCGCKPANDKLTHSPSI